MIRIKLLLLLLLVSLGTFAQKLPDMGLYKVRIISIDKTITAEIKPGKEPEIESDRFYNWYSSNYINQTQGGFSGTLLNGEYNEYYLNKNLKEQGVFQNGLRNGIWKDWSETGTLVSVISWDNGLKDGSYSIFDNKGTLKQKGTYKHGLLNGKQVNYEEKGNITIDTMFYYKDGKVVPAPTPSKFWTKINIFRKKDKS